MNMFGISLLFLSLPALVSAATITATWKDNSTNETGFSIERRSTSGGSWEVIAAVAENVTSFKQDLAPGDSFCYQVNAFNDAGKSSYSNEACVTIPLPPVQVPAAPTDLQATLPTATEASPAPTQTEPEGTVVYPDAPAPHE